MKLSSYTLLSFFTLAFATQAGAQIPERMADDTAGTGYVGVSGVVMSDYLGAANESVSVLPYLSFEDVKGFDLFGTALTYRAVDTGTGEGFGKWSLRAGPRIAYQIGRESEDSEVLSGLEDVDPSLVLGGYVRSTIGPVGLRLDAGQDVTGGHDGLTADLSIGTFYRIGNFAIQPAATISWADNGHNDSFFSLNSTQSAITGLDSFDAQAGIYAYSLGAVSWVEIKDKYAVALIGSYRWYTNDALDSPIINNFDGSENGLFLSLSFLRKFDTNEW